MKAANRIDELSREELFELTGIFAKNWLAHDGCWFLAIENRQGMETAIGYDIEAWRAFTVVEAKRLIDFLELGRHSGVDGLAKALAFRLYARLNEDDIVRTGPATLEYRVRTCRVQEARRRKGLADFPCRPVGLVEYGLFAATIDARFATEAVSCPPQTTDPAHYCVWRFRLGEGG